ncbi:ead/Ea22-like family protein [Salmonella enterica]|nr:ead/Ea22-like family protein [Salmonella enterica]EDD5420708.1 ead/Ea22-like family protein [Salmonella enterica subsp. enterica serovar Enteritidis]EDZ2527978.1 ead/Ea22-like family protein [Salmonella enterica]EHE9385714.1 ead/Ea22-like family protein [Salmonella enterica]EHH0655707.1 ead/Ea22-like family protein [Salmonella enterica]
MSNIDKQALREAAEKATPGPWEMEQENIWFTDEEGCTKHLAYVQQGDDVDDKQDHYNTAFIAAANPATMLALLDENIQLQREKDAIEAVALALRDDMRQAREQLAAAEQERENWRISFDNERYRADKLAAAFNAEHEQLVMANRSLITQHIRANSAESRIAELEAKLETADKLQDSAFRDGLKAGFSYGQTDDQSGFAQCMSAYSTRAGIKVKGE